MRIVIVMAMALLTLQATAQDRRGQHQDFTPEQQATLRTKKMTLDLDLNASQQDRVYEIHLENAKLRQETREARSKDKDSDGKPSADERYERLVERLDHKIATKQKMKAILDKDQYEKWSEMSSRRHDRQRGKQRHKKRQ